MTKSTLSADDISYRKCSQREKNFGNLKLVLRTPVSGRADLLSPLRMKMSVIPLTAQTLISINYTPLLLKKDLSCLVSLQPCKQLHVLFGSLDTS